MDKARVIPGSIRRCQSGMALLVVLWVITLMVLLVLVFSNAVQIAVRTATYRKEAAQAHAFACGGVQAAILEIAYPPSQDQPPSQFWAWHSGEREGRIPFDGGWADLQIVNEAGRLDLNAASVDEFTRLFEESGLTASKAQQIAEALVAWRSPSSGPGQKAAPVRGGEHAPFETVEEALNVPGISRGIFFGRAEVDAQEKVRTEPGVGSDWTVRSKSPQVNINYASEAVLRSVPGVTGVLAQAIIQQRREKPFKTVVEIDDRTAQTVPDKALPYLTTAEAKTYTVISTGVIKGSPLRRTVGAVFQLVTQEGQPYRVVAWYDDYEAD
jgi:type II secretory pathway component PulK